MDNTGRGVPRTGVVSNDSVRGQITREAHLSNIRSPSQRNNHLPLAFQHRSPDDVQNGLPHTPSDESYTSAQITFSRYSSGLSGPKLLPLSIPGPRLERHIDLKRSGTTDVLPHPVHPAGGTLPTIQQRIQIRSNAASSGIPG